MTEAEFLQAKRLRKEARAVFDTQRELVKADLDAAPVGKRITTKLSDDGREMAAEAIDLASRHKAVVSAGAVALTAFLLRKPLFALAAAVLGIEQASDEDDADVDADEREDEVA